MDGRSLSFEFPDRPYLLRAPAPFELPERPQLLRASLRLRDLSLALDGELPPGESEVADPEEVRAVLDELVRHFPILQDARHPRAAAELARDGRVVLAEVLGLPPAVVALWREAAEEGRSVSAGYGHRQRYMELDHGSLAEVCSLLRLGTAPWPPTRSLSAAAVRTLAVAGALGGIAATTGVDTDLGDMAEWALESLVQMLRVVAGNHHLAHSWAVRRPPSLRESYSRLYSPGRYSSPSRGRSPSPRRARTPSPLRASFEDDLIRDSMLSGRSRSFSRSRPSSAPGLASHSRLQVGDEVLAHWALPTGECSHGVEDAEVVGVDRKRGRVRLRYIDGLMLEAPIAWVVRRKAAPPGAPGEADRVLRRLVQTAAPAAEIAARCRELCERPRGLVPLSHAVREVLGAAPVEGQRCCVGALCALCSGGMADAVAARTLANAMLLSGCHLPINRRHQTILQRALVLSDVQRSKLHMVAQPEHHRWIQAF